MFTAIGIGIEDSFAADLNETTDEIGLESDNASELENSQDNEILEVESQDSSEILSQQRTPQGNIYSSIQDAINSANAGDTILLNNYYYSKGELIKVNKQLTITSNSMATLDCKHLSIAFKVSENGAGTVFRNIKFINGEGDLGSAVHVFAKNVRFENCIFEDNHANRGGAILTSYNLNDASGLIVDNCQFRRNTAYYPNFAGYSAAAAVAMYGKDSEIRNSLFEDNWVRGVEDAFGGAIQVGLDEPGSNGKVTNCVFRNNKAISDAHSHGGAGCIRSGTSYTNCVFINNVADEGGALTFHGSGEIKDCTFINNTANEYGGALSTGFLYDSMKITVSNCEFDGNKAPYGGAIQANGLNVIIKDSNFKNNKVTQNGGAIHAKAQDVTVQNSAFNSNMAQINGGAIYIQGKNTVVKDSTFLDNKAIPDANKLNDGLGGAIYVDSTLVSIEGNAFRYNTARNGSAIYYDKSGDKLTLQNNELYQNQAWVYQLPIEAKDIYYEDSERVRVTLYGGNNIGDYDNLAVSNAIYNAARDVNIVVDGEYPVYGATNTGQLYQDSREYNINVLLTIQHEDGTLVYNEAGHTNYLGEIVVDLDNLKPGKYYVTAKHYEDNYYKAITNATTFMVYPKVDNEITKTVSKDVLNYEDVVTWTITVTNHGPNDSTDVKVFDVLPSGLTLINTTADGRYNRKTGVLTIGDLKVGETFTFKMVTVVSATGTIVNRANVTANEFDSDESNNYAEEDIFVYPASDLAVVKTVSNPSPNYKDQITWTIAITNNGPDTAHDVVMVDKLPDSLIYVGSDRDYSPETGIWNVGTLEKGKSVTLNIKCIVDRTGLIENFVSVNGSEYDYDETNNHDDERIVVDPASDMAIVKTVNASTVNYHDMVKWALTVSNNGPDRAENVKVTDLLPEGFTYVDSILPKGDYSDDTFTIDSMEVGETIVIEIITYVENTGNFTNVARVTSDNYDYDLTNNEDDEPIFVNPAADLCVTKSVSDTNPQFNDVITWTVEVVNLGPDAAHQVIIRDLLPDSLIWIDDDSQGEYDPKTGTLFIEELGVEQSYVLNIECRVNATGLIENRVSVNASEYDYNMTNNFDNETIDVENAADVAVVKMVDNPSPNYYDLVTWTLVISNNGPDKANNIYVEDELPEGLELISYTATKGIYDRGLWVMCCLENGETQRLEILCRVKKTGDITNFASIHADEYDYDESNNEDNESIDVPLAVDLQVLVDVNNTRPYFGEEVKWIISVRNNGPDNATGVALVDIIPEGLVFTGYESSRGIYENDVWDIRTLNVGDVVYLNVTTVSDKLGNIINDASVNSSEYDWNMSNNYASDLIDVRPVADISVEKFVNKENPKYGETVKWTIVVTNNGPNGATDIVVKDILPKGLEYVRSNGDYSNNVWKIKSLGVGEKKSLEIVCKVKSTGGFTNRVDVTAYEFDPDESNNRDEESIQVAPASDLAIKKTVSKSHYRVGDVIEYVIEITNNGPDTARNVKMTEILDDLLKLKSFKASKGKFNKFDNSWTISFLRNGESAKLVIKVVATGSGIIKNTVKVTSDTYDYDKSNNKDSVVVNVTENPSQDVSNPGENGLNDHMPSVLEMHPTANPIVMLMLCLMFSVTFMANGISGKK